MGVRAISVIMLNTVALYIIRVVKHGDSDFISLASICLFALCCLPFANRETAINREA